MSRSASCRRPWRENYKLSREGQAVLKPAATLASKPGLAFPVQSSDPSGGLPCGLLGFGIFATRHQPCRWAAVPACHLWLCTAPLFGLLLTTQEGCCAGSHMCRAVIFCTSLPANLLATSQATLYIKWLHGAWLLQVGTHGRHGSPWTDTCCGELKAQKAPQRGRAQARQLLHHSLSCL